MVPDEKIDLFRPIRNNEDLKIVLPTPCLEDTLKLVIPERKVLMVKDTAVIQIVIDNFGIRPIYFAVTVPDDPIFEPFLRNEGMVGRIVPTRGETQMDVDRTLLNLEEVFEYRSIFDDSVNKDDNMKKLVTNYGAAFMRVSQYYHRQGDLLNSAKYLRKALQFIEHKERFYNGLTQLYIEAEEFELALGSIEEHIGYSPQAPEPYIQAVLIHLESKEVDKAFNTFERAVDNRVYDNDFISYIYLASQEFSRQEQGLDLMNRMKTYDVYSIVQDYIDALEHVKDNKLE
jgi:tetratricopeptide (TPR) repeat protein